jgi:WD40 repeat protein
MQERGGFLVGVVRKVGLVCSVLACGTAGCGRSRLESANDGDGAERGGSMSIGGSDIGGSLTGGAVATGGAGNASGGGGAPVGGSGGRPMPPLEPGGPIPNCAADSPVAAIPKDRHWIFLKARSSAEARESSYLVELTPDGPKHLTFLDEGSEFWDWTPDGRFFVLQDAERPHPYEVFDISEGFPVRVNVPLRSGFLKLSHGTRYALDPDPSTAAPSQLFIVDVATATERAIDLPELHIDIESWSPDDRYLALAGSGGLFLVDTSGPALALSAIHDRHASDVRWSADGLYLAFQSLRSGKDDWMLYVYDIAAGQLEIAEAVWRQSRFYEWAGDALLVLEEPGGFTATIDVTRRPLESVILADSGSIDPNGAISPGNECYVYEGYCDAAEEEGICVIALPPNPLAPPVLIQRLDGNTWSKAWAGTGDQLLLHSDAAPWLVNVALDGGEFTRRFVTDGPLTTDVDSVLGWNPSGRSDWLAFFAEPSPTNDRYAHPRLWHRPTNTTWGVALGEDNPWSSAWSPDGRYLIVEAAPISGDGVYYVQEVFDDRLGRLWMIDGLVPSGASPLQTYYVQP